jgi:D-alanyl-lipoteichoic acid acyltransferase DltB (MBOAT superfamily)
VIAMVAFSYQIFFDFQGYSLIAIGLALTFGIKIPINFNSPYSAINPSDFWRRWHITLSQWLRDYVFIPLGGSRASTMKIVRNLIITMLIGGIWHGAGYNFLIWGFLHGLALSCYRYIQILKGKYSYLQKILDMKIFQPLWLFSTFTFVTMTWVFFRLDTFEKAKELIVSSIFGVKQFIYISDFEIISIVTISVFIFGWKFVQDFFEKYIDTTSIYISYLKPVFYYCLLIITLISVPEQFNPIFIYFRF